MAHFDFSSVRRPLGGRAVEEVSPFLDCAHCFLAALVEDLHEAWPVFTKLPAEYRAVKGAGRIDVIGVDHKVGQSWVHEPIVAERAGLRSDPGVGRSLAVRRPQNWLRAAYGRPSEFGGERGIRTPGDRKASTVFKTDAIVRSAISPLLRIAELAGNRSTDFRA